jgi:hypothetical protein
VTSKIAALLNQKNGKERKTTSKPSNEGKRTSAGESLLLKKREIFEIGKT